MRTSDRCFSALSRSVIWTWGKVNSAIPRNPRLAVWYPYWRKKWCISGDRRARWGCIREAWGGLCVLCGWALLWLFRLSLATAVRLSAVAAQFFPESSQFSPIVALLMWKATLRVLCLSVKGGHLSWTIFKLFTGFNFTPSIIASCRGSGDLINLDVPAKQKNTQIQMMEDNLLILTLKWNDLLLTLSYFLGPRTTYRGTRTTHNS